MTGDAPTPSAPRVVRVPPAEAGRRIDQVIAACLTDVSRGEARRLIADGRVVLDGKLCRQASRRVRADAHVRIQAEAAGVDLADRIVHADARLVVIDKPTGVAVQPARDRGPDDLVGLWAASHPGERLHVVHRLDVPASGLVALARTPYAAAQLSDQLAVGSVLRVYRLRVAGAVAIEPDRERLIDAPLGQSGGRAVVDPAGKPAQSALRLVRAGVETTELEARLETGRFHQLRAHLQHIGHPIVGDVRYGGPSADRLHLHACRLALTDPTTGARLQWECPAPWASG